MDDNPTVEPQDGDGIARPERPLGRTLGDVSHLFLSQKAAGATPTDQPAARPAEPWSSPPPRGGMALLRPASISRERVAAVLREFAGALEDGLRAIDASIPCDPCGEIDVLAVSRGRQLTIIDVETTSNDALLARGMAHFDWVVRNMPNLRRMYREQVFDVALQPRVMLLAPQFSPLLRGVARQITSPPMQWVRYHAVEGAGGPGILFEPLASDT